MVNVTRRLQRAERGEGGPDADRRRSIHPAHPFMCIALLSILTLSAQAAPLKPDLAGLGFLLGSWTSGTGKVADTGGTSKGTSVITADAGGAVLLRRDHVDLFDKAGKRSGAFAILMTIYAERGSVHADYFDSDHIIHYRSASIVPGKSVTFSTGTASGAPDFRLLQPGGRCHGGVLRDGAARPNSIPPDRGGHIAPQPMTRRCRCRDCRCRSSTVHANSNRALPRVRL